MSTGVHSSPFVSTPVTLFPPRPEFPKKPMLKSRHERELLEHAETGKQANPCRTTSDYRPIFPLPRGEGQGEGQTGKASSYNSALLTLNSAIRICIPSKPK